MFLNYSQQCNIPSRTQMMLAVANVPQRWNFYETMVSGWGTKIKWIFLLFYTIRTFSKSSNKSQHKSLSFSTGSLFTLHDNPTVSGVPDWRGWVDVTSGDFLDCKLWEKNIAQNYWTVFLILAYPIAESEMNNGVELFLRSIRLCNVCRSGMG